MNPRCYQCGKPVTHWVIRDKIGKCREHFDADRAHPWGTAAREISDAKTKERRWNTKS